MTNDLRIADAPLLVDVSGEEKLPTGGYGNYSTTINQIADFTQLKWKLATEGYVNNEISVVTNKLNTHTQDKTNPHGVTKEQVGLGEVDNTADLDKPVSAYQQSAIDEKIAKTSIVDNLTTNNSTKVLSAKQGKVLQDTKANKSEVYTKEETLTLEREDKYVITESGRTQEQKNKDEVSILDFGNSQLNLGLIDASAYFVLASIYAYTYNKTINLNGGKYLVEQSCLLKPCLFKGDGAEISIKNNVTNFEFEESEKFGVVVGFNDCSIKLLESTGTIIKTAKNSSQYLTNQTKLSFKDLYFYGTNKNTDKYASAFDEVADAYIDLGDALGCSLTDIGIFGGYDIKQDPENQVKNFGIKTGTNGALMTARCSNIEILCCHTGIEFGKKSFFSLTGFDITGAHIGIDASNSEGFNEPNIYFGNINAQHIGIKTAKSSKDINNVTIRRHKSGWKDADWDWYGIYDEGGSDLNISKNTLHVDEAEGVFNGTSYGIYALNTSLSNINENYISDAINVGICLDNTTGINSINTITAQNKSTASVYDLKNNARRYTIANIQEVSSFFGTHITKDSTVLPTSLNYVNTTRIKEVYGSGNLTEDVVAIGASSGNKRWRTVTTTTAKNSQIASDDGSTGVNYDLITRSGTTVTNRELRSTNLHLNASLKIKTPPTFVDNDSAKAGGLASDAVYKTVTGQLMVVY